MMPRLDLGFNVPAVGASEGPELNHDHLPVQGFKRERLGIDPGWACDLRRLLIHEGACFMGWRHQADEDSCDYP